MLKLEFGERFVLDGCVIFNRVADPGVSLTRTRRDGACLLVEPQEAAFDRRHGKPAFAVVHRFGRGWNKR